MAPEPVLHGREVPLAALRASLDGALAGRGGLAVVSGEAGIGKTTIASLIAREAEQRGATVTFGRAWEFADAPPYFPVWPCLRALGVEPHGDAFAMWEQVLAALARAAAPVVWIVEDLHAADLGTLDLLTFLAQPARAMRVLVVATARERDPRVTERMLQRLARMARDGVEIRLEPLDERDVAAVTETALGRVPSPPMVQRLVELTGGNPLFVVECARAFRSAGGIDGTLASLPPTVRQIVLDRVALLPEAAREMLANGAVLGREFSAASVARMAGTLPARAIDALLPALRTGVVRETQPGRFIFSHTLVRDAIEDALDATSRAAMHGRAAAALATLGDSAEVLVERARHALVATTSGATNAEALELATRAAELLEHEGAFDRAFEVYARVETAREAGLLPPADPTTKLHVARVARAAGRAEVSRRLCEAVMADARAGNEPELFARAALLHLADVRPGVVDRAQVALLEEARALLGDRTPALGCRVLARLSTAIQPAPDVSVPMAMARQARARAEAIGDPALIIDVLELAGWGMYEAPLAERIEWSTQLIDRALAASELVKALTGYGWRAFYILEAGDFAAFDRDVASMLAISDEVGHPRHRWRALLLASGQAITFGRVAESDRYLTEVAQLAPLTDDPAVASALGWHRLIRALILRADDDVRAYGAGFEALLANFANAPSVAAVTRGMCAARCGDVEAARAHYDAVANRLPIVAFAASAEPTSEAAYVGELVAAVGTDAERRAMRDAFARNPAREISGGPLPFTYEGPALRVLGLLEASLGDLAAAETHLGEALARSRARGHKPWTAQLAFELAQVLRRANRGDEARVLADESARIAREVGMPGLHATIAPSSEPLVVERAGQDWRLVRGTTAVIVKDSRGMQLLVRLIERANEELHVLALASDEGTSAPESTAGEVLDDRARKAYRHRLAELADALADAESRGDAARATALERERDALIAELARATSLGGKARVSASTTERARVNVQKRLRDAIARVTAADADLGAFLDRAVRTGTFCCFRP